MLAARNRKTASKFSVTEYGCSNERTDVWGPVQCPQSWDQVEGSLMDGGIQDRMVYARSLSRVLSEIVIAIRMK